VFGPGRGELGEERLLSQTLFWVAKHFVWRLKTLCKDHTVPDWFNLVDPPFLLRGAEIALMTVRAGDYPRCRADGHDHQWPDNAGTRPEGL